MIDTANPAARPAEAPCVGGAARPAFGFAQVSPPEAHAAIRDPART